jgi:hypothetical protein
MKIVIITIVIFSLLWLCNGLGYVRPRKQCTPLHTHIPVLYNSVWAKKACGGIPFDLGTYQTSLYAHSIVVPLGYTVTLVKDAIFGAPYELVCEGGYTCNLTNALWNTPILEVRVKKMKT